jgi:dipeptide transport system ATP-binding protein
MTAPYRAAAGATAEPLLEVRDLKVSFRTEDGVVQAVNGVSLSLAPGETLGIVGESGSGKSVTMMSVMRLITDPNARFEGEVRYKGRDLMELSQDQIKAVRGAGIAMIFQDPMTSLNPVYRVGWQIEEQIRAHMQLSKQAARARAIELLGAVGIPHPAQRVDDYPHQFSGGMRQRVMIAMALSCNPDILIADEPTTALDVTIQAQILDLLLSLQRDRGMALILITHNMGVVSDTTERVAVMYAGQIMEERATESLFTSPQHPYTAALLAARPEASEGGRLATIPGVVPGAYDRPRGCLFSPRCAYATPLTDETRPELRPWMDGLIRCHYPLGDAARQQRIAADKAAKTTAREVVS